MSRVNVGKDEQQNRIAKGDVLFTASSETADEVGMSSEVLDALKEPVYLNSFCFGVRFQEKLFYPGFLSYVFKTQNLRTQIAGTANGVTRFNVSKKRFAKIRIPIPSLAEQRRIVGILDKFTALEAELESLLSAELEARKKQYAYYRERLLSFGNGGGASVPVKTLGELTVSLPKEAIKKTELEENGKYPVINSGKTWYGRFSRYNNEGNALVVASHGVGAGFPSYVSERFWAGALCYPLRSRDEKEVLTKFLYYYLQNKEEFIRETLVSTGSIPFMNKSDLDRFRIPVPSLSEQRRIVGILDKFDGLVNDLSAGLPAELRARRLQYEYYREKLLSF